MTCKLSGLFNIGEDFDDERLDQLMWQLLCPPARCGLPLFLTESRRKTAFSKLQRDQLLCVTARHRGAAHTPLQGKLLLRSPANTAGPDDFDDWDVDLADLDECDQQMVQSAAPAQPAPAFNPATSAKTLRPPTSSGPNWTQRDLNAAPQAPGSSSSYLPTRICSTHVLRTANPRPSPLSAPPQNPSVFSGLTVSSPAPSPISRTLNRPQRPWATPGPSPQGRAIFESFSPVPCSSLNSSTLSPHPLHTPVLTNRLVQLVSASNKLPQRRPRSEAHRPRTRRFPGPAGFLPEQLQGQRLDDIVVSVPQTPAHGAVARSPSQGSSSQTEEEEFSGGPWAAMKAEMGLDERNPSCFLHSYSVVMVLRKAALKRLAKNKVPNMAVLLKSIIHTHADAKVVFKDPTGEIQGTVHRRLLEDRVEELKVGAVLLLKQVGVFSPSHRNHYLNVTPNNLLRIYGPDGVSLSSTQLPPLLLEPMSPAGPLPTVLREPVSRMQLVFDEDDDEGQERGKCSERREDAETPRDTRAGPSREHAGNTAAQDSGWGADDDLDELLGDLPEDTYSL
ncbi:putative protein C17orf53 [Dissostichus eleginoides]|uniref:Homologous recombination OB-fold protein OB-fold domain-containing protein n=1 Tax=Dissostichus eleginoides TaxID=100907 RepID=A0AAD9ETX1_DISEL|nr:putative protein C17orf53 [Dissostichus eleginoides]